MASADRGEDGARSGLPGGAPAGPVYRFGAYELDPERGELRRDGKPVRIDPKPLAMLAYLIAHRGRAVPKEELLAALWPDVTVSEAALASALRDARRAVGDTGKRQEVMATYRGRGLRFVADVKETVRASLASAPAQDADVDPFVGRDALLEELGEVCRVARSGRGGLVLASGPPGIGKTRLLGEVATLARGAGCTFAVAWCRRGDDAPYRPWSQWIRRVAAAASEAQLKQALGRDASDLARLAPELAVRVDRAEGAPAPLPPDEGRLRLFEAVSRFLREIASARPLLLLLDDAQWGDRPSLALLEFMAADLADAPIAIMAAFRDVGEAEAGEGIAFLSDLGGRSDVRVLEVPPLEEVAARRLAAVVAGAEADSDAVGGIVSRSGGNPLFVRELASALRRGSDAVPTSVRVGVAARLRALPEAAQALVETAAVIGGSFDVGLLGRAAGTSRAALHAALRMAEQAALVRLEPGGDVGGFPHGLIQETVLGELDSERRAKLHARVGEAMDALFGGESHPPLDELARHFHASRRLTGHRRAIGYGVRAAQEAADALAPERAAVLYERVLETLDEAGDADPRQRFDTLLALAAVRQPNADAVLRAVAVARDLGDCEGIARAVLAYTPANHPSFDPSWSSLCEEALAEIPERAEATRARLLAKLAMGYELSHDAARGGALSREAVALARRSGDETALLEALDANVVLNLTMANAEEMKAAAEEAVALCERRRTWARSCLGVTGPLMAVGDRATCDRYIERFERWSHTLRSPHVAWYVRLMRAWVLSIEGGFDELAAREQEIASQGVRFGIPHAAQMSGIMGLYRTSECGDREARLAVAAALGAAGLPWSLAWRARILAREGQLEDARSLYEGFVSNGLAGVPRNPSRDACVHDLASVCCELGDRPRAAMLLELLAPFSARGYFRPGCLVGPGGLAVGRLHALLGQRDAAEAAFDEALRWCTGARSAIGEVHTRIEQGALWLASEHEDLRHRGRLQLAATRSRCQQHGWHAAADRAQRVLAEAG